MMSLLIVTTVLGCTSSPLAPESAIVTQIVVTPDMVTSEAGRAARFTTLSLDADGNPVPGAQVEWTSVDPSIAVVDSDGTVWSFSSGSTGVEAKSKGNGKSSAPGQVKKSAAVTVQTATQVRPDRVTDLAIESVTTSRINLVFTEVDDGTGQPSNYLFRFQIAPLSWSQAANVTFGSCGGQLSGISIGNRRVCSVSNLQDGTNYEFQVVAIRGGSTEEFGYSDLSNIVGGSTQASQEFAPANPGGAVVDLDFELYANTTALRDAKLDFGGGAEDLGLNKIFLDENVAFPGLTKSMRYDWVNQGTGSVSIGRGIDLPSEARELWVEIPIRWSTNFTTCNPADPPCDHKTLFLQVSPDGNGRWDIHFGGGGAPGPTAWVVVSSPWGRVEGDSGEPKFQTSTGQAANEYFDGQWHIVRWHVRHSTNVDTMNGLIELWVDGVLLGSYSGFSTNTGTRIRRILVGRNKDKGLDSGTESMWTGRVRAWDTDPGW